MKTINLAIILLLISVNGFSENINDTIRVVISLKQIDSLGLKINVYPSSDLNGNVLYQFPKSVPGIYEYLSNHQFLIRLRQGQSEIRCINNSFLINSDLDNNKLSYSTKATNGKYRGVSAEDTYYLKDSIYILNWHYILGYFNTTNSPYKIEVNKPAKLFGSGALPKKTINDTTDIYFAHNYKNLIHNPIMYSIPDTVSFQLGKTNFIISCAGNDSLLNSKKIKDLIYPPLTEIYRKSSVEQEEYSFLYFSEYSLIPPYLTGLEHPNSTMICYHPALLDNKIFVNSSIHEFVHAVFAPLQIRSEILNDFNFGNPQCDDFLWLYEGVTEYLTIKTLVNSGFFSQQDFLNELNESNEQYKNINLSKVSSNIYKKKEQKLFDNFYTKGSLFAMQLDIELIKRSNGKTNLLDVMQKLQASYNPENPFNPNTFIVEFSKISGLDIQEYISKQTHKKTKINFERLIDEIGYTKELTDTTIWTYNIKKNYLISDYKKNRFEIAVFGSLINKKLNVKKVTIYEVDGEPLNWYNDKKLLRPERGQELSFKAYTKAGKIEFTAKPEQVLKEKRHINWIKNRNTESNVVRGFWNE